jgi:RNA polymerase sigma factor (sigma-70 family)
VIGDVTAVDAHRAVEAVWRIEAARIIAGLSRMLGDVGLAEEFAQDALVAALEQWPESGVPPNPGAWLTVIAKRRAIDRLRRAGRLDSKLDQIGHDLASRQAAGDDMADAVDDVDDDLLRLVFICCHPVLSTESQVALALRLLGGLTTAEIARAFLSPEATVAQRIVRAKRTLSERRIPFEVPPAGERTARLSSVLGVIYLIFNEGYAATAGDDWMRPALFLAGIAPGEAEVHGLVALMEIQASRTAARTDPSGTPIPLLEQNRGRWDQLLIRRGFAALLRAEPPAGAAGPYVLQAAIAACHARARTAQDTDWVQIASLYEALDRLTPSPVVRLNHAVAIAMVEGPATGLDRVDTLACEPALKDYPLLPSVRGDLLARLGRHAEARAEFERAAALASNARVRAFVLARAAECARDQ